MPDDKPIHVPRAQYPEMMYPAELSLPASPVEPEQGMHLRDYWNVIVAKRWVIAAVLLTSVAVTMIVTLQTTPVYTAETTVQIDRENQNILDFKDVYQIETQADDALATEYKILASRALARRVVEKLKLDRLPEFAPASPGFLTLFRQSLNSFLPSPKAPPSSVAAEPDRLRPFVDDYLTNRLVVTAIPRTRLVKISFEARDPGLAAAVVNEHAREFINQNLQFKFDATTDASDFLSDSITGLKATLEKSEDKLQDYSRQNQIMFTDDGKNTATEKLQQLEAEFTRAQADRIQKEALVRQIEAGKADSLPQLLGNMLISQLSVQAADLRRQESNLAVTFAPDWPERQRLRSQIAEIDRQIQNQKDGIAGIVKSEYAAANDREKLLGVQLDQQTKIVENVNEEIIQYNILKREVDTNKQIYEGLLTRLKEAGVSAGLRASNIRVVDWAEVPIKASRPQKTLNLLLSILGGLVAGVGIAFLQEYMDNTVKSPDDVTRILQIPTLAVIPKMASLTGTRGYRYGYGHYGDPKVGQSAALVEAEAKTDEPAAAPKSDKSRQIDLIIHNAPTSLMAEAYRSLRTSLLLSAADHAPRTILVTSSLPSEGKTATAMNLAVSLTQSGARTLLIDADMRKPRIHAALGLGNAAGLSSFLTGAASLKDVIHDSAVPNLYVIPCGAIPPNPGELILSSRFNRMIDLAKEYFEYIVLDSPPLSHVSDARVLANSCEAVLIVIKAASTSRNAIRKATDQLEGSRARMAGAVLNDVDVRKRNSDYSYYYNKGYSGSYGRYGGYGR